MISAFVRPTAFASTVSAELSAPDLRSLEESLILNRVTEWAWQVCDSRCTPHSPGYLLGFIEHVGDGVELMQLGDKFIWTRFPSVRDALAHLVATAAATATDKNAGDLAWVI
jgi:hypothetical protein